MSSIPDINSARKLSLQPLPASARYFMRQGWRALRRCLLYLPVPIATGYFAPKLLAAYVVCGLVDVLRTRPWKFTTLARYFMGQGFGTWLTSPFNLLVDVLALPYRNKGVYQLADLPPDYQAEINAVIAAAEQSKLSQQLESRMAGCQL